MSEYEHWNDPNVLPPVGCPLILKLSTGYVLHCERIAHISEKSRDLTYQTFASREIFTGRYPWTYP